MILKKNSVPVYLLNENRLIQNIQLQILRKLKPLLQVILQLNKQYSTI